MSSVYPLLYTLCGAHCADTTCAEGDNEVGDASKPVVAIPLPLGMTVLKSCGYGRALSAAITAAAPTATKCLCARLGCGAGLRGEEVSVQGVCTASNESLVPLEYL